MRKREIAVLLATIALCWPTFVGKLRGRSFTSSSSSIIGVQLAQEGGVAGGSSTSGPIGGAAGGPVEAGSAACAGKSAGDSCSFTAPDGQTVNGACTTIPNQLLCVAAGGMINYGTGEARSQPEGDR
jgi:hypothetical protein